jgi:hypothetical protein
MGTATEFTRDEAEERRAAAAGPGVAFTPTSFDTKYRAEGRTIRCYAWARLPRPARIAP